MPGREREVTLRFLAEPSDINFGGKVHGGAVMKWIDQAGYTCAVGWSGQYCVTAYVGGIRFHRPILIGSLVQAQARLIYTGRSSMHISVDISAGDPRFSQFIKTAHCIIIFVAVDAQGNPVEVPPWEPKNAEDLSLQEHAKKLMELRKAIETEMSVFEQ